MSPTNNDQIIVEALKSERLKVDLTTGFVYCPLSNTPGKPAGAKTIKGYLRICINIDGRTRYLMAHRIVCIADHGLPPCPNYQVDHKNGIHDDNHPENLEWVTNKLNMARARKAGKFKACGRKNAPRDSAGRFKAGRLLDGKLWDEYPGMINP